MNNSFQISRSTVAPPQRQQPYQQIRLKDGFRFPFNGFDYPVYELGRGEWHICYAFAKGGVLQIDGKDHRTEDVVLKVYNQSKNIRQQWQMVEKDLKAYRDSNVPLPPAYLTPEQTRQMFWILEREPTKVTCDSWANGEDFQQLSETDRKTLLFAQKVLTFNAWNIVKDELEFANDFRPDNVMLNKNGDPVVIDWSLPDDEGEMNLNQYLREWSAGNDKIFEFLIAHFPENIQNEMRERKKGK